MLPIILVEAYYNLTVNNNSINTFISPDKVSSELNFIGWYTMPFDVFVKGIVFVTITSILIGYFARPLIDKISKKVFDEVVAAWGRKDAS